MKLFRYLRLYKALGPYMLNDAVLIIIIVIEHNESKYNYCYGIA
jgi:hypothetical protein